MEFIRWDTVQHLMQKFSIVGSIVTNTLLIYLVVSKSPNTFGSYKKLIICIAIFEIIYGVVEFLASPILHSYKYAFVVLAKKSDSLVDEKVLYVLLVLYTACFGSSMGFFLVLFLYRYLVSSSNIVLLNQLFDSWKCLLWLSIPLSTGYLWSIAASCFVTPAFQNFIRCDVNATLGVSLDEIVNVGAFIFLGFNEVDVTPTIIFTVVVTCSLSAILYFGVKCYKTIKSIQILRIWSRAHYKLQLQSLHALILQTATPLLMMHIPAGTIFLCSILSINSNALAIFVSVTIALFPVVDPLPNIFIIKEYREGFFGILKSIRNC